MHLLLPESGFLLLKRLSGFGRSLGLERQPKHQPRKFTNIKNHRTDRTDVRKTAGF